MKRGEIYLIKRRDTVGSEITKTRPAVVVSNNSLNAHSEVVEVVYLTTQPRKDMPTHVCINATGTPSVAICEQIDSVSLLLVCGHVGTCTAEEMKAIDEALATSLDLITETDKRFETDKLSEGEKWLMKELGKVTAERDRYAKMLDVMLSEAQA